jgi:hypothetical protein
LKPLTGRTVGGPSVMTTMAATRSHAAILAILTTMCPPEPSPLRSRECRRIRAIRGGDVNYWGKILLEIFPLSPIDGHDKTTSASYESGHTEGHIDGLALPANEL